MKFQTKSRAFVAAAAIVAAMYAVPAAQAFTIENQGGGGGSGQGFLDLDKPAAPPDRQAPVSRFGNENGQTTLKQGNTSFQFGQQRSFGERYNSNNLFNPYAREGR
jgi:hypothetical protein